MRAKKKKELRSGYLRVVGKVPNAKIVKIRGVAWFWKSGAVSIELCDFRGKPMGFGMCGRNGRGVLRLNYAGRAKETKKKR